MFKMMGSIKQWSWVLLIGLLLGGLAWWMAHKPFPPKPQADQTYRASSKNLLPWHNLPPLLRSEELLLGESLTEGAYTLSLTNLGYPAPISLVGAEAETTLYLPVNPGLEAEALDLLLAALPEARGVLEVLAAERPLLQAPLPAKTLRVPLKGVPAENGFLTLTLRVRFPAEDLCAAQRLYRLRLLPESRLHLSGRPTPPKTLAEFFPPYLERVVLYLPDPPPPEAAQATLWLAGFLARTYPGRVPELDLEPYPPRWPPASPFTRYVVWLEEIGAQVQGFALLLGDLAEAARLFLAQPGLREAPFPGEATQTLTLKAPEELGPRVSLAQLGHGPKRVEGYGTLTAAYTFALADLGPDHLPLGLRLRAVHSPVEPKRGYAELLLNGVAFYTAPLEGTVLDLYTPLPSRLLERNNTLEVRFHYAPPEGRCTYGALPFTATLDPGSYLVLGRGELLSGLDAFPQALLPQFWVYLEPLDRFKLQLAARLVQALQETTRTPLRPEVASDPHPRPLLALGGPGLPQTLKAPLRTPGFRLVDGAGTLWLEVNPGAPYAALQAFASEGGPVLLLSHTSQDGRLLAPFLQEALREGWFGLHGDLVLGGPEGPVVSLALRESDLRVQPLPENPPSLLARYRREVYLGLGLLALLLLVWFYPKVVRRGKA